MRQQYLLLKPIAPFRLDLTTWALRRRTNNIIDRWDKGVYQRVLIIDHQPVSIAIEQTGSTLEPTLRVKLSRNDLSAAEKTTIKELVNKILGTSIDLRAFYKFCKHDNNLGPVVKKYIGFKPPRFASVFEAAVNGICCQQLSLTVGIILLNRLATACSQSITNNGMQLYAFPKPDEIRKLRMSQLQKLGFSSNKARALLELAINVIDNKVELEKLETLDDQTAIKQMLELRGLGRWTAEYVLLRGLGRVQIYPGDDVALQKGLKRWLKLRGKMDYRAVQDVMSKWKPYGGMIYFHLLLERLSRENLIHETLNAKRIQ
jgi:DNA-3-methyladenine glycosylase II